MDRPGGPEGPSLSLLQRVRAVAELLRLANVFTAVADVWMGLILTIGGLHGIAAVGITTASALLYLAGMVLNDLFDRTLDATERPERPLPSGRVSVATARLLGWSLLGAGLAAGWGTAVLEENLAPGIMASLLASFVVLYDAWAKKTTLGPGVMALCRICNVLLGMSVAIDLGSPTWHNSIPLVPALAIGIYIFSITWFARSEAGESPRGILVLATVGVVAALGLLAAMPWLQQPWYLKLRLEPMGWLLLWGVIGAMVVRRMVTAILQPRPKFVQRAVGQGILSLIIIDAGILLGYSQPYWACGVLALLAPAVLLSQWLKVT